MIEIDTSISDMDAASSETQPSRIDKSTAFLSSIGGFVTAMVALISLFATFPEKFRDLFLPHQRESGFVKAAKETNAIVFSKRFSVNADLPQCNAARQTYADLRTRVPSADRVGDVAKAFDEAEGHERLEAEYRALAKVFVNLDDAVAWKKSAGESGCLNFD